jgi:hypothetical protein
MQCGFPNRLVPAHPMCFVNMPGRVRAPSTRLRAEGRLGRDLRDSAGALIDVKWSQPRVPKNRMIVRAALHANAWKTSILGNSHVTALDANKTGVLVAYHSSEMTFVHAVRTADNNVLSHCNIPQEAW